MGILMQTVWVTLMCWATTFILAQKKAGLPYFILRPDQMPPYVIAADGDDITLDCEAFGQPPLNISWFRNGEPISDTEIAEQSNPQYQLNSFQFIISSAEAENSGQYRCEVENELGDISHEFTVKVIERHVAKPILHPGLPKNVTATKGSNVTFECQVLSSKIGADIDWIFHKGPTSDFYYLKDSMSGISIAPERPEALTVLSITNNHEGYYTCIVANTMGATFRSGYLTVAKDNSALVDSKQIEEHCEAIIFYMAAAFILSAIAVILAIVCFKLYRDKKRRIHILAKQLEHHPVYMHSTKTSSIIRQDTHNGTVTLLVTIRKSNSRRGSKVKEETNSIANEYEIVAV